MGEGDVVGVKTDRQSVEHGSGSGAIVKEDDDPVYGPIRGGNDRHHPETTTERIKGDRTDRVDRSPELGRHRDEVAGRELAIRRQAEKLHADVRRRVGHIGRDGMPVGGEGDDLGSVGDLDLIDQADGLRMELGGEIRR